MTCLYPDLGSASAWLESRHQYGISALVTQTSFYEGSSGDLETSAVFSGYFCSGDDELIRSSLSILRTNFQETSTMYHHTSEPISIIRKLFSQNIVLGRSLQAVSLIFEKKRCNTSQGFGAFSFSRD